MTTFEKGYECHTLNSILIELMNMDICMRFSKDEVDRLGCTMELQKKIEEVEDSLLPLLDEYEKECLRDRDIIALYSAIEHLDGNMMIKSNVPMASKNKGKLPEEYFRARLNTPMTPDVSFCFA